MSTAARQLLARPERQASILRGAAAAFARSGFAATSMEDVAAACEVSKLILYRHFDSKEGLYRTILERVFLRMGEELDAGLRQPALRGVGVRTILTVAREDPDGFVLLWRHAAREPQFAEYAHDQRELAVAAVRELMVLKSGDETMDHWSAESTFGWLIEAVLTWLEFGDPDRDAEFVERSTAALRAMRGAWG
ncbi:MAG TPA: helix-turn-helix domain-containing protein [Acidimicrobiales bacterium]|jgi:AcrR family transcriptional regulator|nr:helix-turn-helix domain-containing protein [Acidimicrobiales bacterium]